MKFNAWLLTLLLPLLSYATENSYSPKLVLRTGVGMLKNEGEQSGSSGTVGGFNLQYVHFLNARLAAGFGYMSQFDPAQNVIPISGYEILGRVYFGSTGTVVETKNPWGDYVRQPSWASYASMLYGKRSFYLGQDKQAVNDPTKNLTGDYSVINLGLGVDYRLNRNFEVNMEYCNTLIASASSDSRVRIFEGLLWTGVNYAF